MGDTIFKLTHEILKALNNKVLVGIFSLIWKKPFIPLIIHYFFKKAFILWYNWQV